MAEAIAEAVNSLSFDSQLPFPREVIEKILLNLGPPGSLTTINNLLSFSMASKQIRVIAMADPVWRYHLSFWSNSVQDLTIKYSTLYEAVKHKFLVFDSVARLLHAMVDASTGHQRYYNRFLQPDLRYAALDPLEDICDGFGFRTQWKSYSQQYPRWLAIKYHAWNVLRFLLRRLAISMLKDEALGFIDLMFAISMLGGGTPRQINTQLEAMSSDLDVLFMQTRKAIESTVAATNLNHSLHTDIRIRTLQIGNYLRDNNFRTLPLTHPRYYSLLSLRVHVMLANSDVRDTCSLALVWLFITLAKFATILATPVRVGDKFVARIDGGVPGQPFYLKKPFYFEVDTGLFYTKSELLATLRTQMPEANAEELEITLEPCSNAEILQEISHVISTFFSSNEEARNNYHPDIINGWYTNGIIFCIQAAHSPVTKTLASQKLLSKLVQDFYPYDASSLAQEFAFLNERIEELSFEYDFSKAHITCLTRDTREPPPPIPQALYKVGQILYQLQTDLFCLVSRIKVTEPAPENPVEPERVDYLTLDEHGVFGSVEETHLKVPSCVPDEIISRFFLVDQINFLGEAFQTVDLSSRSFVPNACWLGKESDGEEVEEERLVV